MFQYIKNKPILILFLICVLAFLLRFPGVFWGVHLNGHPKFVEYISGEDTYVEQANAFMHRLPDQESYYTKGLAFQIAAASSILKPFGVVETPQLTVVGRFLSVIYGTLSVALLFFLVKEVTSNIPIALLSALFFSIVEVHMVYSCVAATDAGLLFWIYALIYSCFLYLKTKEKKYFIFALIAAGFSLAFKLAVISLIPLVYIMVKDHWGWKKTIMAFVALFVIFYLANGGTYSFTNFIMTLNNVSGDNLFARDYNKFQNLLCYMIIIFVALKIPTLFLVLRGAFQKLGQNIKCDGVFVQDVVWVWILPLVFQFISVLFLSYADGRHILLFFPLLSVIAAIGFISLKDWPMFSTMRKRAFLLGGIIAYYLIFLGSIDYNFIFESRDSAASWIMNNVPKGETIALPRYSVMPSLEKDYKIVPIPKAKYIVLHKEYYTRFIRSIGNPFEQYPKWENVFHSDRDGFEFCQGVFKGKLPYKLVKKFHGSINSPEVLILNKIFGPITGYDNVLIYEKIVNP